MSLLSRVLLKSACVCAKDAGASSGIHFAIRMNVVELHSIQQKKEKRKKLRILRTIYSRSSCLNSRRVAQPRSRLLQTRVNSMLDAKLLESNPSFPIIRHELASGPAHPLINAFLIERLICFSFHKRD